MENALAYRTIARLMLTSALSLLFIGNAEARRGFLASLLEHAAIEGAKLGVEHAIKHGSTSSAVPRKSYGPDTLNPEQLEVCVRQARNLDEAQGRLEAEAAVIKKIGELVETSAAEIKTQRSGLDSSRRQSVDAFNKKIDAHNEQFNRYQAAFEVYKTKETNFNSTVISYNGSCAKRYYSDDMRVIRQKLGLN